jgi:hypothetical protein
LLPWLRQIEELPKYDRREVTVRASLTGTEAIPVASEQVPSAVVELAETIPKLSIALLANINRQAALEDVFPITTFQSQGSGAKPRQRAEVEPHSAAKSNKEAVLL